MAKNQKVEASPVVIEVAAEAAPQVIQESAKNIEVADTVVAPSTAKVGKVKYGKMTIETF